MMDRDKLIERADILMFERGLTFGDAIVEAERETQPPDPGSGNPVVDACLKIGEHTGVTFGEVFGAVRDATLTWMRSVTPNLDPNRVKLSDNAIPIPELERMERILERVDEIVDKEAVPYMQALMSAWLEYLVSEYSKEE